MTMKSERVDAAQNGRVARRDFLRVAGLGGLILSTGGIAYFRNRTRHSASPGQELGSLDPREAGNFTNPLKVPAGEGLLGIFEPSAPFTITSKVTDYSFVQGKESKFWVYEVTQQGKTYQNPILKLPKGGRVQASYRNQLGAESIIHWHGLRVDTENDGHPHHAIPPSATYDYDFTVLNRAAAYWYHPHPHGQTAQQVYFGLAGFMLVEDEEEQAFARALDLEPGTTDIPLLLQDRLFNNNGAVVYTVSINDYFMGILGDVLLVNNTITPYLDVDTRFYRFRVLNGSNSRNYRLAFLKGSDRLPFFVVGNDGGLLDKPYPATEVTIATAERLDLLVDLRNLEPGDVIFLKTLGVDLGPMGKQMHGMHTTGFGSEVEFFILKLNVKNRVTYDKVLPGHLSEIAPLDPAGASTRPITLSNSGFTQWTINGKQFRMTEYPIMVNRDATEIWEIKNVITSMPHPMHIHGYPFQVLERIDSPRSVRAQAVDEKGLLPSDKGWKDTVLVWPGETLRYVIDFRHPFPGEQIYLFHCHILEHEDGGMMINYKVV
ncbi:MAG: multicopper oxidase domain-containing protein [Acidobacteria bacterium]|nr:multicopper oxidase domain-containing protein [Acidobacteriota bacterium]